MMDDLEASVDPSHYGAVLWGGLHTLGQELVFSREAWMGYVRYMREVLSPAHSPATGCAECWGHFEAWCEQLPPEEVMDWMQASRWGWMAHNAVRRRQGKPRVPWEEAAARWDW